MPSRKSVRRLGRSGVAFAGVGETRSYEYHGGNLIVKDESDGAI